MGELLSPPPRRIIQDTASGIFFQPISATAVEGGRLIAVPGDNLPNGEPKLAVSNEKAPVYFRIRGQNLVTARQVRLIIPFDDLGANGE